MNLKGVVLLEDINEQRAAGRRVIHPRSVRIEEWKGKELPVFLNGLLDVVIGNARELRVEDARLIADIELVDSVPPHVRRFGIYGAVPSESVGTEIELRGVFLFASEAAG